MAKTNWSYHRFRGQGEQDPSQRSPKFVRATCIRRRQLRDADRVDGDTHDGVPEESTRIRLSVRHKSRDGQKSVQLTQSTPEIYPSSRGWDKIVGVDPTENSFTCGFHNGRASTRKYRLARPSSRSVWNRVRVAAVGGRVRSHLDPMTGSWTIAANVIAREDFGREKREFMRSARYEGKGDWVSSMTDGKPDLDQSRERAASGREISVTVATERFRIHSLYRNGARRRGGDWPSSETCGRGNRRNHHRQQSGSNPRRSLFRDVPELRDVRREGGGRHQVGILAAMPASAVAVD